MRQSDSVWGLDTSLIDCRISVCQRFGHTFTILLLYCGINSCEYCRQSERRALTWQSRRLVVKLLVLIRVRRILQPNSDPHIRRLKNQQIYPILTAKLQYSLPIITDYLLVMEALEEKLKYDDLVNGAGFSSAFSRASSTGSVHISSSASSAQNTGDNVGLGRLFMFCSLQKSTSSGKFVPV